MKEETIVRNNLMNEPNYSPYCGSDKCLTTFNRAKWCVKLNQFKCNCGWVSKFPNDFIERYKLKWNK
jgi:hypothetical protein